MERLCLGGSAREDVRGEDVCGVEVRGEDVRGEEERGEVVRGGITSGRICTVWGRVGDASVGVVLG